jgi:hypothetical protein
MAPPRPNGSRKRYFLRVSSAIRTPREAVAWTYGLTAEQYADLGSGREANWIIRHPWLLIIQVSLSAAYNKACRTSWRTYGLRNTSLVIAPRSRRERQCPL